MFEEIIESIQPVLNVMTAVVLISLGIVLCAGCIMLAIKTCGHFNALVREKSAKALNRWAKRADNIVVRIGKRIGQSVREAIQNCKSPIPEDLRPRMAGEWISDRGDFMTISEHGGYYKVKFDGAEIPGTVLKQEFILRDIQGWLHDDNVYCAESLDLLTLGVSDDVNEIFVAELKRTYFRFSLDNTASSQSVPCEVKTIETGPELRRILAEISTSEEVNGVNRNIIQ